MAIGNPINLTSNVEGKNISVIATAGQTQFTVTGGYRINQISVFRNGVRLVDGRDFTAADGVIVTLLSGALVGDVLEFQVFDDFRVSDALNVNSGGTVNGDIVVTGIVSTNNLSIGTSISLDATSGIITAVQVIGGTITGTATTATNAEGLTGTPDITVNNIVAAAATFSGVLTYEDVTNIDSLGIVTARTGVDVTANGLVVNAGVSTFGADLSIADKIIHSGDTNTAIRFPSNDKFTVETAGVQRLEVDSNGDLGLVGIATATGLVVVAGSGGYAGHTGIITAVTFDGNVSGGASGDFTIEDKIVHSGDTNTAIRFPAADTFTVETGGSERLRVGSDGLLTGKGAQFNSNITPSSGNGVEVFAPTSTSGQIQAFDRTNSARSDLIIKGNTISLHAGGSEAVGITSALDVSIVDKIIHTGDTNTAIRFPAADTFTVETGGTERIRIDSSGNFGVGEDTPLSLFHVKSGDSGASSVESGSFLTVESNGNASIQMLSGTSSNNYIYFGDSGDTNIGAIQYSHGANALIFYTNASERLRIDSAGDMGLGVTPNNVGSQRTLHIKGPSGEGAAIRLQDNGDTADSDDFWIFKNSSAAYLRVNGTDSLRFYLNGAERALIDSSGRLLINTDTSRIVEDSVGNGPQGKIQIEATNSDAIMSIISAGTVDANRCGTINLGRHRNSNVGGTPTVVQNGDALGSIVFSGGDGTDMRTRGATIIASCDGTPGENDMPTRLMFSTRADGGSMSERLRIDSRGSFQFSNGFMNETVKINTTARTGTQAVNLDDGMVHYFSTNSSGTWKPNFTMSAGNDINATIATGDVFSPTMIVAKGATTHFANSAEVDGTTIASIEFLGGAPTDGGASGTFDVYNYTIIKTGNDAFKAFISVSNYE